MTMQADLVFRLHFAVRLSAIRAHSHAQRAVADHAAPDRLRRGACASRPARSGRNPGKARIHLSHGSVARGCRTESNCTFRRAIRSIRSAALRLAIACGTQLGGHRRDIRSCLEARARRRYRSRPGAVAESLGIADVESAIAAAAVKEQLRANTDEAIASGVFGVPTLRLGRPTVLGQRRDADGRGGPGRTGNVQPGRICAHRQLAECRCAYPLNRHWPTSGTVSAR